MCSIVGINFIEHDPGKINNMLYICPIVYLLQDVCKKFPWQLFRLCPVVPDPWRKFICLFTGHWNLGFVVRIPEPGGMSSSLSWQIPTISGQVVTVP